MMKNERYISKEKEKLTRLEEFKTFLGERVNDVFYTKFINFWEKNGDDAAIRFCINDADKFYEEDVKLFIEQHLFKAGKEGLDKKTPWNNFRRMKAGLPILHEYEIDQ